MTVAMGTGRRKRRSAKSPLSRSEQMSRIRGRNTSPELELRRELWARGLRYRIHYTTPSGKADLAFPGRRIAIFIDGCFWHGCPEHYVRPRTRTDFWARKLRENVERDQRQTRLLEERSWRVIRLWEHEVFTDLRSIVEFVENAVRGDSDLERLYGEQVIEVRVVDADNDLEERLLVGLTSTAATRKIRQQRHTRKW